MNSIYNTDNIKLTSAEIANIWSGYIFETLMHHIFTYLVRTTEDTDIKAHLEYCILVSRNHIDTYASVFQKENLPVPRGTTSEDVNLNAQRLFTDKLIITYMKSMAVVATASLAASYTNASRIDIRRIFKEHLNTLEEVDERATEIIINKGFYVRAPYVEVPNQIDFVKRESFFTGFLGEKRPLTVLGIMQLHTNGLSNALGKALLMGFSQVAKLKEVHEYLSKGKELSDKYFRKLSDILMDEDITALPSLESEVLPFSGTESPFSDRFLLIHCVLLNSYGLGTYGLAMGQSQRNDLSALYARIIMEVAAYAKEGADLLVQNGWLEQAPAAPERKNLVNV